eukprot:XP_001706170.1 Hypothetical protein GL50803_39083 [Giardia lamblia ATCC 50803]
MQHGLPNQHVFLSVVALLGLLHHSEARTDQKVLCLAEECFANLHNALQVDRDTKGLLDFFNVGRRHL